VRKLFLAGIYSVPSQLFWGSARVLRAGVKGRTRGRAGPLAPRPRGTIYEALPIIRERDREEGSRRGAYPNRRPTLIDGER
jgi:hypothetical protein